jgi:Tol biopolymer transport system component
MTVRRATVAVLSAMRSLSALRAVVLFPAMVCVGACEVIAPLKPLPTASGGDGGGSKLDGGLADGHGDGSSDSPVGPCDPSMPFGMPTLVYGLNRTPGTEYRVHLSLDELTAYVSAGYSFYVADLYTTSRASRGDPFGPLDPLTALNDPGFTQLSVSLTADGLKVFFDSNRSGGGLIYAATRPALGASFGAPTLVQVESSMLQHEDLDPYVLPDGSALYFTSDFSGDHGLYRSALVGTTPTGPPTEVLAGDVRLPVLSPDELTLYYATTGRAGGIDMDIQLATRTSRDAPFGPATSVTELNTTDPEYPGWLSPDGCRLYFFREPAPAGGAATGTFSFVAERIRKSPDNMSDAGTDTPPDGDTADGGTPSVACDTSKPFLSAVPVDGLNRTPGTEYRVSLSSDELTAYVSAGSSWQVADLYTAMRPTRADTFAPLTQLTALNSPDAELNVSVTANGLTLFMDSNRSGEGRIYSASRSTTDESFGPPGLLSFLQITPPPEEFDPYVLPDGTAVYFTANTPTQGAFHRATLNTVAPPTSGAPAPVVATFGPQARNPVVTADELTIYFALEGSAGTAWGDIWMATRAARDLPFNSPVPVTELNTSDEEYPQWISPDGCRLYFSRQMSAGAFSYVAERAPM